VKTDCPQNICFIVAFGFAPTFLGYEPNALGTMAIKSNKLCYY